MSCWKRKTCKGIGHDKSVRWLIEIENPSLKNAKYYYNVYIIIIILCTGTEARIHLAWRVAGFLFVRYYHNEWIGIEWVELQAPMHLVAAARQKLFPSTGWMNHQQSQTSVKKKTNKQQGRHNCLLWDTFVEEHQKHRLPAMSRPCRQELQQSQFANNNKL